MFAPSAQAFPRITASIGATETQINLAAYGLNTLGTPLGSTLPSIVGPFQYVQAQGNLNWNALSMANVRNYHAANAAFNGYYGAMGPRPTDSHGVFVASGTLSIPVFDGGKISADVQQARALRQRQAEHEDQKAKVEQTVRNAPQSAP